MSSHSEPGSPLSPRTAAPPAVHGTNDVETHDAEKTEQKAGGEPVESIDPKDRSRSTSDATKTELAPIKTVPSSSDDNTLHGMDLVKSVATRAKRKLHLDEIRTSGPSNFFNPTNVRIHVRWKDDSSSDDNDDDGHARRPPDGHAFLWNSRDNRKGRNSIAVPISPSESSTSPRWMISFASHAKKILKTLWKMFTTFPYWDMSFWSGWSYTWGSVLFVLDGSWAFTEAAFPGLENPGLTKYGGPLCFFFGALLYQVGATMAYLEAVNDGSFQGSAMRRFLEGNEEEAKKLLDERIHNFFTRLKPHKSDEESYNTFPAPDAPVPRRGAIDLGEAEEGTSSVYLTWRWYPDWHTLRTHHVYEIGYLACAIQLFGATLYGICGVVALPGILTSLQPWQKEGAYWVPQIVASVCFLTAGLLFTIETQEKIWKPEVKTIGWWIGLFATIGSVGFLLSAIFGAIDQDFEWAEEQSDLSSTWGSFAYLLSGALQWYEATDKKPIDEILTERGPMKSYQVHPI